MNANKIEIVKIQNGESLAALAEQAAAQFVKCAKEIVKEHGLFSVVLSGGSTPQKMYEFLADENQPYRSQIPWQQTHFFFGDERHVPPDHSESNFKMANDAMFARVSELPIENVHRVLAENAAADAANLYEEKLRRFFKSEIVEFPRFDLILLGLGADGHTASLFPGSEALQEPTRFFTENYIEKFKSYRLTLTFPVINNARHVLFLVGGREKAAVVRQILKPQTSEIKFPAQLVNPTNGELLWLLDEAAASEL